MKHIPRWLKFWRRRKQRPIPAPVEIDGLLSQTLTRYTQAGILDAALRAQEPTYSRLARNAMYQGNSTVKFRAFYRDWVDSQDKALRCHCVRDDAVNPDCTTCDGKGVLI